uniref:Gem-associated protein 7 n=1 Tax=Clastoptera arizonana TaxID=38151 RepID=A0A1B6DGM1_9HEMI
MNEESLHSGIFTTECCEETNLNILTNVENEDELIDLERIARSFLRERFLRIISHLSDKTCELSMYENTNVKAIYQGCDNLFTKIILKNLECPLGIVSSAVVRINDIIVLKITS